jgi:hypothetical protein
MQFVVKERRIAQEGKNKGEEYWTSPKYIVNFKDVLKYVPEQVLRSNDDISTIIDKLNQIEADIKAIENKPVIYVKPEKEEKENVVNE